MPATEILILLSSSPLWHLLANLCWERSAHPTLRVIWGSTINMTMVSPHHPTRHQARRGEGPPASAFKSRSRMDESSDASQHSQHSQYSELSSPDTVLREQSGHKEEETPEEKAEPWNTVGCRTLEYSFSE